MFTDNQKAEFAFGLGAKAFHDNIQNYWEDDNLTELLNSSPLDMEKELTNSWKKGYQTASK